MPSQRQIREILLIALPLIALVIGAFVLAYQFVEPAPPRRLTMTTGSAQGAYNTFGERYAKILARSGITLDIKTSAGSIENLGRLMDPKADVQVAFMQGGIADAKTNPGLESLGRVFVEPLWIFHRADLKIERVGELAGLRVAVGAEGSGTRVLAMKLLEANKVSAANATLLGPSGGDAAKQLIAGEIDAAFFTLAAASELAQKLLRAPSVKLLSLKQAEAYTRLYPFLSRIVLPAGVVDLAGNIPAEDVALVAPVASLVARADVHPALIALLVEAAKEVHSEAGLFQRPNEFPQAVEAELPLNDDAARFHKSGPPFLQRYLPFWLATFVDRMAIMMIPIATILLPLMKIVPMIYQWRIRRRIMFWYDRLKKLEASVRADRSASALVAHREEIARIEDAVGVIPVPLMYSDQFYSLRAAVDLVRQRISGMSDRDGPDRGRADAADAVV
jgi:TRAP transporter TAXI family solute receptor